MEKEPSFFRMPGPDKIALVLILAYAVVTFALIKSEMKIAGVSIFGWLMGALMFFAPIVSIIAMKSRDN